MRRFNIATAICSRKNGGKELEAIGCTSNLLVSSSILD